MLGKLEAFPKFKDSLIQKIKNRVAKDGYAFSVQGDPLVRYLNLNLLPDKSYQIVPGFELYKKHKSQIDDELFNHEKTGDDEYKAIIAQHLFNKLRVYTPKASSENALDDLWKSKQQQIIAFLQSVKEDNKYVRFDAANLPAGADVGHIVITDTQMADQTNKAKLETFLETNSETRVILNVGNSFVNDQGQLDLASNQIPENLAHLIITNTQENAKTIGNNFLRDAKNLQSFDTSGMTSITTIWDCFLSYAKSLQSFDTSGMTNVTTIGPCFLLGAESLQSFAPQV